MRTSQRFRVTDDGRLEIVDPGFDVLALIQEIDPSFDVRTEPLENFHRPRFIATRAWGLGCSQDTLSRMSTDALWRLHRERASHPRGASALRPSANDEASILDLKATLARRLARECSLCARRCRVDRLIGERGICGLGLGATVAEHFVHIGEEPMINPSLVLNLAGCGLRCRYCQQSLLLDPVSVSGSSLTGDLWSEIDVAKARSLSFVGGNPDESLPAVFSFLAAAPAEWALPIVWNSHAYATPEVLHLLDGVVDVYVPDFKYGSDVCAARWSGVSGYVDVAFSAIAMMVRQNATVIVRLLVLPGHLECCHLPVIERLAQLDGRHLYLSIRNQYCPDWRIGPHDGDMAGRAQTAVEILLRDRAIDLGLAVIGNPST